MNDPVRFSDAALQELKQFVGNLNLKHDQFLRIGIKTGGCAGMNFLLAFDNKEDSDNVYEIQGIQVVINRIHLMYVLGMEVDWENTEGNKGFVFKNLEFSN